MFQISLRCECTSAFLSAAQLTVLASALLHLQAFAQKHFRYWLTAVIRPFSKTAALTRLAAVHERKFEVLALNGRFHHHQTFAALGMYVSLADQAAVGMTANRSHICQIFEKILGLSCF